MDPLDPKTRPVIQAVLDLHEERGREAYFPPEAIEEAIPLDPSGALGVGAISNLDAIAVLFPLSQMAERIVEAHKPDADGQLCYRIRPDLQGPLRASYGL